MKISVVIPAYNEEERLAHTINALLTQKYPHYEIIVVDNASTDRTAEIASKFPVKLVHESRKGLLWAREAGRQAASGAIIANIDADCLPSEDWLERGVSHFKDERVVAVTGPYDYYDADPFFRTVSLLGQKYIYRPMNSILQMKPIRAGAVLIGGNNFIRVQALEKAGGYNTSLTFYGEDTDTAKRVAPHGKVIFNPSLRMKTSARRVQKEGAINLMLKYWYHFVKQIFKKKTDRV